MRKIVNMLQLIKLLFGRKHHNPDGKRPYTDEEKKFALEVYHAMGLKHSYWVDEFGHHRYTDEALGGWQVEWKKDLLSKYERNV